MKDFKVRETVNLWILSSVTTSKLRKKKAQLSQTVMSTKRIK